MYLREISIIKFRCVLKIGCFLTDDLPRNVNGNEVHGYNLSGEGMEGES